MTHVFFNLRLFLLVLAFFLFFFVGVIYYSKLWALLESCLVMGASSEVSRCTVENWGRNGPQWPRKWRLKE
jgi:hypothetical protein